MKYALITPSIGEELFYENKLSYHMALAQYLISDAGYLKMYKMLRKCVNGAFIIVDNGAAEGDRQSFDMVVKVADEIEADEIVMPDMLRNGPDTVRMSTDPAAQRIVPPKKRFVVPQGRNLNEWTDCLTMLEREMDFRTIGVPKHLISSPCGSRNPYLDHLEMFGYPDRYDIHLLGLNSLTELHDIVQSYPWIRGVDSGMPVAWAQAQMKLSSLYDVKHSLSWSAVFDFNLASQNVETILEVCRKEV